MDCGVFIIIVAVVAAFIIFIVAVGGAPIVVAFATTKFKAKSYVVFVYIYIHSCVVSFVLVVKYFVVFVSFSFSGNVIL